MGEEKIIAQSIAQLLRYARRRFRVPEEKMKTLVNDLIKDIYKE